MLGIGYSFSNGSASGARRAKGPLGAAAIAGFGAAGGVALGALAVVAFAASWYLAFGAFAACIALNLPSALLTGALTIAAINITGMCARGSGWMFGSAKGAILDSKTASPAAQMTAPAQEAPRPVPRYAGIPPRNEFYRSAGFSLVAESPSNTQARRAAPQPKP